MRFSSVSSLNASFVLHISFSSISFNLDWITFLGKKKIPTTKDNSRPITKPVSHWLFGFSSLSIHIRWSIAVSSSSFVWNLLPFLFSWSSNHPSIQAKPVNFDFWFSFSISIDVRLPIALVNPFAFFSAKFLFAFSFDVACLVQCVRSLLLHLLLLLVSQKCFATFSSLGIRSALLPYFLPCFYCSWNYPPGLFLLMQQIFKLTFVWPNETTFWLVID